MLRIVKTKYGLIEGLPAADPRVTAFKGIPFAAPPVGINRWRAPQSLQPWDGTYKAYRFAPISVQDIPGLGTDIYCREWHVDPEIEMNEDCLYLNVWTNAKNADEKLPVLVWIFGGAFQWGYTSEMEFDGERIARRGIVVVTVNYRLGALGFLAHPQLSKEQPDAPSNFGLLDQQAGLRWVKENISAFGGDPDNITIAGQSAGGASVLNQITTSSNKGFIDKAIVFSGMFQSPYHQDPFMTPVLLEKAEQKGLDFFEFLGVQSLEEAREMDAFKLRDLYAQYASADMNVRFAPIIDHVLIKENPIVCFANARSLDIPVMAGHTMDEFRDYLVFGKQEEKGTAPTDLQELTTGVYKTKNTALKEECEAIFGDDAFDVLSFEETSKSDGIGFGGVNVIETGVKSAFISRQNISNEPCYFYQFDVDIPGEDNPGSFHSVDLWFFFETLAKCSRPFVGRHYDIARKMCNYWCNFIKTGNPNGYDADGTKLHNWEPFTQEKRLGVRFTGNGIETVVDDNEYMRYLEDFIIQNKF